MKRYNRRYFTLIELMFVVFILAVLIGVSWVAGTKTLRKQAQSKTKAEITMLVSAVKQYYDRYGTYFLNSPGKYSDEFKFGEYLSKVSPNSGWTGKRPMFIDFRKHGIDNSNDGYDDADAGETVVKDPYGNPYVFVYKWDDKGTSDDEGDDTHTFIIFSRGLNGEPSSVSGFEPDTYIPDDDDISSANLNK